MPPTRPSLSLSPARTSRSCWGKNRPTRTCHAERTTCHAERSEASSHARTSIITYGFFGEDQGQGRFLAEYLRKIEALHPVLFDAHPWFGQKYQGVNNKGVDKGFREAWLRGFSRECELDCLFVGRDLDSNTTTIRAERHQVFSDKIADIDRPNWWARTVFILPMQCIEHWLLALQRRADGRPSKDTRDLEGILNDAVKRELYDEHPRTPATQTKDELVTALAANLDIAWLAGVSASFHDFHQQVEAYLVKHVVA